MDDLNQRLGQLISAKRIEAGLSQEQLAEAAGLHWTYVSGIERGKRNPSVAVLVRLGAALGTTGSALLSKAELHGDWRGTDRSS